MSTEPTTNEKIAQMLLEQTYAERMEIAESFRDTINSFLDNHSSEDARSVDRDDIGLMLQLWAEEQLTEEASP